MAKRQRIAAELLRLKADAAVLSLPDSIAWLLNIRGADVPHVKVEDGPGRRLGRSFGVKLWPTLVFLRDGVEVEKLVRPQGADDIVAALQRIA